MNKVCIFREFGWEHKIIKKYVILIQPFNLIMKSLKWDIYVVLKISPAYPVL